MHRLPITRLLLFGCLLGILALTPLTAFAAPPTIFKEHNEFEFELGDCGNGNVLVEQITEDVTFQVFTDQDGNDTHANIHINGHNTITNLKTGQTLRDPVHINLALDFVEDTITAAGIGFNIHVPGQGTVFLQVGRIIFDFETGEFVFSAGPKVNLDDLLPTLCAALAV